MPRALPNPELLDPAAVDIVRRLRGAGHEALLVGGCVRDLLLGRTPVDFDIATSARPEEVRALFRRTVPVGEKFGVVLVRQGGATKAAGEERDGGGEYQVATFRTDEGYTDHRRPDRVRYGSVQEDAARRDFTINGLYYDPVDGRVVDHVGGAADLAAGLVRTIGDPRERFAEDYLRMLRAVRFACRFGWSLDPSAQTAITELALHVTEISPERIRDELVKTCTGPDPARALELLHATGLLKAVLPEMAATAGVEQPLPYHPEGDVLRHTGLVMAALRDPSPVLAMGALLHDVGKPATFRRGPDRIRFDHHAEVGARIAGEVCRRLRFSNEERERIVALVADHLRFIEVKHMRESTLKRFLRTDGFDEHLELHRADCLASHGMLDLYDLCRERLETYRRQEAEEALRPKPLLTGHDLIDMGYAPGPVFAEILVALEDAQLEGRLSDRREARAWVQRHYPPPALRARR